MPQGYILSHKELQQAVNNAVTSLFEQRLPEIIRKSNRKEWLNVQELSDLTGWSKRTIYYLKSQERIPFSQENHRILFPTSGIEKYLRNNMIDPTEE